MSVFTFAKTQIKFTSNVLHKRTPNLNIRKSWYISELLKAFKKTHRRILSGIKTLGETPAHFFLPMFSLEHFISAGTCLQIFRIVDIRQMDSTLRLPRQMFKAFFIRWHVCSVRGVYYTRGVRGGRQFDYLRYCLHFVTMINSN